MLTTEQIEFIKKHVSDRVFYRDRLINYLNLHDMVGIEVFEFVDRRIFTTASGKAEGIIPMVLSADAECDDGFKPISVDVFLHRLPYNFYIDEEKIFTTDENGKEVINKDILPITTLLNMVGSEADLFFVHGNKILTLDETYDMLDFLHYENGYSMKEIFNYLPSVTNDILDEPYPDWFEYIEMCRTLGWTDYMPRNLYYQYNLACEALGKEPILFPIETFPNTEDYTSELEMYYRREGRTIELMGHFPTDENGNLVLRWIGVDIKDAAAIIRGDGTGRYMTMKITLSPKTVIHALIPVDDSEVGYTNPPHGTKRVQIYAGPQTMSFNHEVIKKRRNELRYTQKAVAEAVGSNTRTYQKWENGETVPDGYYLLRILNWLDITNVNDVIIYGGAADDKEISW